VSFLFRCIAPPSRRTRLSGAAGRHRASGDDVAVSLAL
jgi:hypothetical protein